MKEPFSRSYSLVRELSDLLSADDDLLEESREPSLSFCKGVCRFFLGEWLTLLYCLSPTGGGGGILMRPASFYKVLGIH